MIDDGCYPLHFPSTVSLNANWRGSCRTRTDQEILLATCVADFIQNYPTQLGELFLTLWSAVGARLGYAFKL